MLTIAVTGAAGGLGGAVLAACSKRSPAWRCIGFSRKEADLTDPARATAALAACKPDVIVHCAAMSAVDACETEKERAYAVNVEGTRAVARAAEQAGARLVYISTDYVFDGKKLYPYAEDDAPDPLCVYGQTKLEGERIALETPQGLVVRTSWLYSRAGKSFPATVLKLARAGNELRIVYDQIGAPTYAPDLADALLALIEKKAQGVFHVANAGTCTWHEFATAVLEIKKISGITVMPITTGELGRPAPRPANSRLDCAKYGAVAGTPMRHWRDALKEMLGGDA